LTENLIRYVFYQVVEVVNRVHQRGVVHLDIKPENVMFDTSKGQIVLIDFGFSEMFDMHDPISVTKKSGSIEYCAPEIYFESLYDGRFADVWSMGVLLYVLLFRRFPFNIKVDKGVKMSRGDYLQAMFEEKVTGSLLFPDKTASSLRSLLCGMLAPNPEDRLSTGEIMSHEWFAPLKNAHHLHLQQQTLHVNFKHNSKFAHTLGHYVNVAMQVAQNSVQSTVVANSTNFPSLSVASQATNAVAAVAIASTNNSSSIRAQLNPNAGSNNNSSNNFDRHHAAQNLLNKKKKSLLKQSFNTRNPTLSQPILA
jgi:serine/threonine protein kinase